MPLELTADRLREILNYDPKTGVFTRKIRTSNSVHIGDVTGYLNSKGYLQIHVNGKLYLAHRLAWFYVYGVWPKCLIDHKDTNRSNNRILNLREATNHQNLCNRSAQANNTSGEKGVSWDKQKRKYRAVIMVLRKQKFLGYFKTVKEAAVAYSDAAHKLQGEFFYKGTTQCQT